MSNRSTALVFVLAALVGLFPRVASASGDVSAEAPAGSDYEGEAFVFEEVRPGIFHARGTGALAVGSNGAVVVNDEDVLVVDTHMTPAAAWALVRELPRITDKPVRWVVNTHFHFDHVHGNQVFGDGVEIVSHEFTRERIASGGSMSGRGYDSFMASTPARIAVMEKRLAEAPAEDKAELERGLAAMRQVWAANNATVPTAPGLTLSESLTLHRGGREIELHFFGRGHTGGDVVVYLPREKTLITGDLLTNGLPYMGDGFALEWAATLESLAELEVEVVLPGHGAPFEEVEKIGYLQAYLRDLWGQAVELHGAGVSAAAAADRIDMTAHSRHYEGIEGPGVSPHTAERIWELLDADAPRP